MHLSGSPKRAAAAILSTANTSSAHQNPESRRKLDDAPAHQTHKGTERHTTAHSAKAQAQLSPARRSSCPGGHKRLCPFLIFICRQADNQKARTSSAPIQRLKISHKVPGAQMSIPGNFRRSKTTRRTTPPTTRRPNWPRSGGCSLEHSQP